MIDLLLRSLFYALLSMSFVMSALLFLEKLR